MLPLFIIAYLLPIISTAVVAAAAGSDSGRHGTVTVVSGYWEVKSKHLVSSYEAWFRNTLRVQCPYVFFHDSSEVKKTVTDIRSRSNNQYPTHFIQRNLTAAALKFNYGEKWTHPKHVRTADLAVVWLDKVHMMAEVAALNPFHSEWFAWIGR
jgi:hypothetical protein